MEKEIDFKQELYKHFGHVKDFTLSVAIAKRFYEIGNLSNVERNGKNWKEEPISEELETEIEKYFNALYRNWTKKDREKDADVEEMCRQTASHFAQWQKEQFENNRLKHCDSITNEQAELEQGFVDQHLDKHQRIPTYLDAIEYGMQLQKEQMIKNAVDGVVAVSAGCDGWVNVMTGFVKSKDVNVKFGDKIKIIIIKENLVWLK